MNDRILTDRHLCIGSENCARYAPATFELDEEGKVRVLSDGTDSDESVRSAVEGCPVQALTIEPSVP